MLIMTYRKNPKTYFFFDRESKSCVVWDSVVLCVKRNYFLWQTVMSMKRWKPNHYSERLCFIPVLSEFCGCIFFFPRHITASCL